MRSQVVVALLLAIVVTLCGSVGAAESTSTLPLWISDFALRPRAGDEVDVLELMSRSLAVTTSAAAGDGRVIAALGGAAAPLALTALEAAANETLMPLIALSAAVAAAEAGAPARVQRVLRVDAVAGRDVRLGADASLHVAAAADVRVRAEGSIVVEGGRSGGDARTQLRLAEDALVLRADGAAGGATAQLTSSGGLAVDATSAAAADDSAASVLSTAANGLALLTQTRSGLVTLHRGGVLVEAGGVRIGAGGHVVEAGGVRIESGGLEVLDGGVTLANSGGAGLHVRDGGALLENPDENGAALTASSRGKFFVNSVLRLQAARADATSAFRFIEGFVGAGGSGSDDGGGAEGAAEMRSFAIFGNGDIRTEGSIRAAGGVDGTPIGGATPAEAHFTNLTAAGGLEATPLGRREPREGHFTALDAVEGIDATTIGARVAASGRFTTLEATAGIDQTTIGAKAPSAGTFTTLHALHGLDGTTSACRCFFLYLDFLSLPSSLCHFFSPPPHSRREGSAPRDSERADSNGRFGRHRGRHKDTIDRLLHDAPRL